MNKTKLKIIMLILVVLAQFQSYSQINNASDVIKKMKSHYSNEWYSNFTFKQKTSFYSKGALQKEETWYEAGIIGRGLVIKIGSKNKGNGYMFKNDSMYVFREGALVNKSPIIHDILELGFNVYGQDAQNTIDKLTSSGIDFSHFKETDAYYKIGNPAIKQAWIEKKRLLFSKIISIENGAKNRIEFNKYQKLAKGWIAPEVLFYTNGVLTLKEEYFDVETPKKLPKKLFKIDDFKSIYW